MTDQNRHLSPREREVADALCAGVAPRHIALRLGISLETVRKHRASAYRKLGIASVAQLISTLGPSPAVFIRPC